MGKNRAGTYMMPFDMGSRRSQVVRACRVLGIQWYQITAPTQSCPGCDDRFPDGFSIHKHYEECFRFKVLINNVILTEQVNKNITMHETIQKIKEMEDKLALLTMSEFQSAYNGEYVWRSYQ